MSGYVVLCRCMYICVGLCRFVHVYVGCVDLSRPGVVVSSELLKGSEKFLQLTVFFHAFEVF